MASDRVFSLFLRRGRGRTNDLGKMSLGDLVVAYVTYPTIVLYAVLAVGLMSAAVWMGAFSGWPQTLRTLGAIAALLLLYPFFEYALHRFVLHNRLLYKSPLTADMWKRIHYDHHKDPNRLNVLFGSPSNTLLAIFAPSVPLGLAIGGWSSALANGAAAVCLFSFYEFCHCVQHLNFTPRSAWLRRIKKQHMAHHFHNETGNFGITLTFVDRLFGTFYEDGQTRPRSVHVYDLGYDEEEARRYPWVAARSREPADQASAS
jgi:sterol desaturase/sphingolipid hydroxylase (fatty acid hydroxylase superfamily)